MLTTELRILLDGFNKSTHGTPLYLHGSWFVHLTPILERAKFLCLGVWPFLRLVREGHFRETWMPGPVVSQFVSEGSIVLVAFIVGFLGTRMG